jgi:glycine cleavage system aminomethyltransferase T
MARRVSPERQQAAFVQAGQREIARGTRPLYRVRRLHGHQWTVEEAVWITFEAASPSMARDLAHAMLASVLDVTSESFDVEIDDADVTTLTPPKRDGQVYGG